jgi:hypothetical protein
VIEDERDSAQSDANRWYAEADGFRQQLAERDQQIAALREGLATIVQAFTSGIYCAYCGASLDDGCDCIISVARALLAPPAADDTEYCVCTCGFAAKNELEGHLHVAKNHRPTDTLSVTPDTPHP